MKKHPHAPDSHSTNKVGTGDLTTVELLWLEKRIENRVRFGRPVSERFWTAIGAFSLSPRQHLRLRALDVQRLRNRLIPHRYSARRDTRATLLDVPWITPGGESLLRLSGWPKVERVLQMIDAVEALDIDPADAAPDYWHHVHNRLSVNETPRPYTRSRHQAWLHRRRVDVMSARCADDFHDICCDRSSPLDDRRNDAALHMERIKQRSDRLYRVRPATS